MKDRHREGSHTNPPDPAPSAGDSAPPESDSSSPRRGFGLLSRRIARWSGNLLLTCVIIILGLTLGRQVLRWWRGDPPPVAIVDEGIGAQLSDPGAAHLLAFGELPLTFERTEFEGTEAAALNRLRQSCRAVLDPGTPAVMPVDEQLLRRLLAREPVEQGDGWRIVQYSGPIITVVVLRTDRNSASNGEHDAGQIGPSVVSWGLGLRAAETGTEDGTQSNRWTLFTCSGGTRQVAAELDFSLPIPPESRRTLAMRVRGGGALFAFTGPGTAPSIQQYLERAWGQGGWVRQSPWQQLGASWHAEFRRGDELCEVQLLEDDRGAISGIMNIVRTQKLEK